jgi:hypothetical protein
MEPIGKSVINMFSPHHNGMPRSKHLVTRKGASFDGLVETVLLTRRSILFSIVLLAYYSFYVASFLRFILFLFLQYPRSHRDVKSSVFR